MKKESYWIYISVLFNLSVKMSETEQKQTGEAETSTSVPAPCAPSAQYPWLDAYRKATGLQASDEDVHNEVVTNLAEFSLECSNDRDEDRRKRGFVGNASVWHIALTIMLSLGEFLSDPNAFTTTLVNRLSSLTTRKGHLNLWSLARDIVETGRAYREDHSVEYTIFSKFSIRRDEDDFDPNYDIHSSEGRTQLTDARIRTLVKALRFYVKELCYVVYRSSIREELVPEKWKEKYATYRTNHNEPVRLSAPFATMATLFKKWFIALDGLSPDLAEVQDAITRAKDAGAEERKKQYLAEKTQKMSELKKSIKGSSRQDVGGKSKPKPKNRAKYDKESREAMKANRKKFSSAPKENPWKSKNLAAKLREVAPVQQETPSTVTVEEVREGAQESSSQVAVPVVTEPVTPQVLQSSPSAPSAPVHEDEGEWQEVRNEKQKKFNGKKTSEKKPRAESRR